jgi:hypothetical protein
VFRIFLLTVDKQFPSRCSASPIDRHINLFFVAHSEVPLPRPLTRKCDDELDEVCVSFQSLANSEPWWSSRIENGQKIGIVARHMSRRTRVQGKVTKCAESSGSEDDGSIRGSNRKTHGGVIHGFQGRWFCLVSAPVNNNSGDVWKLRAIPGVMSLVQTWRAVGDCMEKPQQSKRKYGKSNSIFSSDEGSRKSSSCGTVEDCMPHGCGISLGQYDEASRNFIPNHFTSQASIALPRAWEYNAWDDSILKCGEVPPYFSGHEHGGTFSGWATSNYCCSEPESTLREPVGLLQPMDKKCGEEALRSALRSWSDFGGVINWSDTAMGFSGQNAFGPALFTGIDLAMSQTGCTREQAHNALCLNYGDVANAITSLLGDNAFGWCQVKSSN